MCYHQISITARRLGSTSGQRAEINGAHEDSQNSIYVSTLNFPSVAHFSAPIAWTCCDQIIFANVNTH